MITENIMLRSDLKKELKHLSIDKDIYVSSMLIYGAELLMVSDPLNIPTVKNYNEFDAFTMKIDEDLKRHIKDFCQKKEIRIKDFWNEVGRIIVENEGELNEK